MLCDDPIEDWRGRIYSLTGERIFLRLEASGYVGYYVGIFEALEGDLFTLTTRSDQKICFPLSDVKMVNLSHKVLEVSVAAAAPGKDLEWPEIIGV